MRIITLALLAILLTGCGDETELDCDTTVECSDERESLCDPPITEVYSDGTTTVVRSCVYATYEHCFEKTVCREITR